jgi:acyl homoserine lactone synthase
MRLMPTTGPTLLYDVFRRTFPVAAELSAPGIWEGTRMCVHDVNLKADHPEIEPGRAFGLMLLALCECSMAHGIHTMVSNYEPHLKRIYQRAGAKVDELGRADGFGKRPVCCGSFEVSTVIHQQMRSAMGVDMPLYRKPTFADRVGASVAHMAA